MSGSSFQSNNKSIAETAFVEDTLDNFNYLVKLKEEDIANVARIEYGWYGVNDNIIFKVIESKDFEIELRRYKDELKEKQSLTFIINLRNFHWVTLVITRQNQKFSANYVDSLGEELPSDIKEVLTSIAVTVEELKIKQENDVYIGGIYEHDEYNCGIYALENAKVINDAFQQSAQVAVSNLQLSEGFITAKRREFATALCRRNKIVSKFNVLLKFLDELNKQESKIKKFNYENANILLFFLETFALQDPIINKSACYDPRTNFFDYQQKLVDHGIINLADFKCVRHIRSFVFHRDAREILIDPADFKGIVNLYEVKDFFQDLRKFVHQTCAKLKGEMIDENNFKKLNKLFKSENVIQNFGKTCKQMRRKMSTFFKCAITLESYNDNRFNSVKANEMMFNFVVNIIPYIDKAFKNSELKRGQPLGEMKWFRGSLIHQFYESGNNYKLLGLKLKKFMRSYRSLLFKFFYSQKVYRAFNTYENRSVNYINNYLKNMLERFQNEFGKCYLATKEDIDKENSFEFVASELVHSKIENKSDLENCVHEYFKLMTVIDNERAVENRVRKHNKSNVPARYKKLSANDRREIYEDFKLLKEKRNKDEHKKKIVGNKDVYDQEKKLLQKKLLPYGLTKDDINAMIKSYVENDDRVKIDELELVTEALKVFIIIKKDHPNFSNQDIFNKFDERKDFNTIKSYVKNNVCEQSTLNDALDALKKFRELDPKNFYQDIIDLYNKKDNKGGRKNINAFFKSYEKKNSASIESILTSACNIFKEIQKNLPNLSIQDIIDKLIVLNEINCSKPPEEKIYLISEGKTINISVPSGKDHKIETINTDIITKNIFEMFNNTYVKYCLVFNNIEEVFNDDIFLDYLENQNFKDIPLQKVLKIDYMTPFVARLITKYELKNKSILTHTDFLNTVEKLLKNGSYIKHLKKLLKEVISSKELKRKFELGGNKENIIEKIYEPICNFIIINDINIENMYLIFEEPEHTEGLLNALLKKIDQETVAGLIKKILGVLNCIANELYLRNKENELDLAITLLDSEEGAQKARTKLISEGLVEENELINIQAKYNIARIKNRQGQLKKKTVDPEPLYQSAKRILSCMQKDLKGCSPDGNLFPHFLLTLSDLAFTHHLLHECDEAYTKYNFLYKEMIKYILNMNDKDLSKYEWSVKDYDTIDQSQEYKRILKVSPKYLNILKIKSDMANELKCLDDFQSALNILNEVYTIKTDRKLALDNVKTIRAIAYIHIRLGRFNLSNDSDEEKLKCALDHFEKACEKNGEIEKIMTEEKWETHPAVYEVRQNMMKVLRYIADTSRKLGDLKQSNSLEREQYYTKAIKIYDELLQIQEERLGVENEYTLKTMDYIARTKNYLAKLKFQDNAEEASNHYKEAIEKYKKILEIQKKTLAEGHNKIKKTQKDLEDTNKWMNDLDQQSQQAQTAGVGNLSL